jgi:hypothetical protein
VAYVGSSGINVMDYSHNVNSARLASPSNPINGITTNTTANVNARVPYLGFTAQGLQQNGFDGVYNYNSLQTTVRKQFSKGHAFQAAYTWSRNLSNVGFGAANVNDPNNKDTQYGPTYYSRPHRFIVSYQYELPFKAEGALGKLVGGWSVSGLTLAQQGNPLTLQDSRGGTVYLGSNPSTVEKGSSTAQLCAGKTYADILTQGSVKDRLGSASNPSATRFFNGSAFCAPRVIGDDGLATDWGTTGIGIVLGPGQFNTDFSVTKMTRISERETLQFRAEFFNLFNHPQFANPISAPNQIGGGGLLVNNAQFGVISSTSVNPRLIQFALRLQF